MAHAKAGAIKYGQSKPINVELRVDGQDAIIRVIDHGIGIDDEHQKKLFQRFERAVATRDFGGFGLGLWITRQIVEVSAGKQVRIVQGQLQDNIDWCDPVLETSWVNSVLALRNSDHPELVERVNKLLA